MTKPRVVLVRILVCGALLLRLDTAAAIDAWDKSSPADDTPATGTELIHGSDAQHDLQGQEGAADVDWYRVSQQPFASYEFVVDAVSGAIAPPIVERIDSDGVTVLQSSQAVGPGIGGSRSLRWHNASAGAVEDEYIRVTSGGCSAKCKSTAVYRLRFFDSPYSSARFNNSGTQVTVLLVQNPQSYAIAGAVYLWNANGTSAGTQPFSVAAKNLLVFATQTIAPGVSGSITVAHDGRYGDLSGKTVALEPATGFSFDTSLEARPH
ncbi:MAG: hypothetical protein ACRERC_03915 [Candidatus Binatia bacterium]